MTGGDWGGKRPGAGSGGPRPGAGRPRSTWNSGGPGAIWIMERQPIDNLPQKPESWRILSVGIDEIEFQNIETEEIIILRKPD